MGGVPPPRGRVQVPIATQDVRLGPWHVEALRRLDWEWCGQQSPELRGSGSGTHELQGRGGTPPRSPRLRRSSASAVQSGDSQRGIVVPLGTWTADKGWLCGGRGPGSSPSQSRSERVLPSPQGHASHQTPLARLSWVTKGLKRQHGVQPQLLSHSCVAWWVPRPRGGRTLSGHRGLGLGDLFRRRLCGVSLTQASRSPRLRGPVATPWPDCCPSTCFLPCSLPPALNHGPASLFPLWGQDP